MVVATASVSAIVTAARALNMSQKGVCELESVGGTKEVCGRIVQRKFATLAGTVKRKFQVRNNGSFVSVRTASIQTLHGTGIAVSPLSLSLSASLCSHCLLSLSSLSLSAWLFTSMRNQQVNAVEPCASLQPLRTCQLHTNNAHSNQNVSWEVMRGVFVSVRVCVRDCLLCLEV